MTTSALIDEKFPSKVAAAFTSGDDARAAAVQLATETGISEGQIRVVEPNDPALDRKLEPESRGIARTLVKAHVKLGIAGLITGLLIALALVMSDLELFNSSPFYTFGLAGGFGAVGGMLLAGLVSLRPDHDRLIMRVQEAARHGRWFVLVHARDHAEERKARDALKAMSDKVIGTF